MDNVGDFDHDLNSSLHDIIQSCSLLQELRLDHDMVDDDLAAIGNCCPQLVILVQLCNTRPRFTTTGLIAMLVVLVRLEKLFIRRPPKQCSELFRALLDRRVLVSRIAFGTLSECIQRNIEKFRKRARKMQLLPVPVISFVDV